MENLLKKQLSALDAKKIGLIGHSEGAIIAPIVASQSKDIAFLVLLAGAASTSIENNIENVSLQLHADGATDEMISLDHKIRKKILSVVKEKQDRDIAEKETHKIVKEYLKNLPEDLKLETEKLPFAISENKG